MRPTVALLFAFLFSVPLLAGVSATPPSTTNNDDSCDIVLQPAATLLLPYFEVDFNGPREAAVQTIFTIQNVSAYPQIANVTLWTDWGFPALSFPIFLTGYGVQPVNLYDIFTAGAVPPASSPAPLPVNPTLGSQPFANDANPNFLPGASAACANTPSAVPPTTLSDLRLMFTGGNGVNCAAPVGGAHEHAIGYATIDVAATCSPKNPGTSDYFAGTILFDNVLTGDYQEIVPRGGTSYAFGGPLVHIRAIPEGGAAGAMTPTNLPYTFYDRYTAALPQRTADRRQPLPSAFVPRFIEGGAGGFNTSFKIWRETGNAGACALLTSSVPLTEVVRFDEHENAVSIESLPTFVALQRQTPATSMQRASGPIFPPAPSSGDVGGWMYLNLNGRQLDQHPSQSWVISSLMAEPTYAAELPAIALGDGCSPARLMTSSPGGQIEPAPNKLADLSITAPTTINNDDSCDIANQPAATLLLPYFEVDFTSPQTSARQTLFTIQNASALPQIANVTLWTDWGYPAFNFPIFLTGYDVHPINLYDLFGRSTIVDTSYETTVAVNPTPGSQARQNNANPNFLPDIVNACDRVPGALPQSLFDDLRRIFTTGNNGTCQVGGIHANAIGYITIDVVATCAVTNALSPGYFATLLYDNVLTGDYEQIVPRGDKSYAQGAPLVHIRAIPEGGPAGAVMATSLPYTFYDHYTSLRRDRRQPLPSAFAPRWIENGGLKTTLKIWREGLTPAAAACASYRSNSSMPFEAVRFDEHENSTISELGGPSPPPPPPGLPATAALATSSPFFPPHSISGDVGGWMYLNLSNGQANARPSQNWVITSMFAQPTYATEATAPALGNGCSPRASSSFGAQIGPAPNPNP